MRRAAELNAAIPTHLNWILNSLADAGSICLGGLVLVWFLLGKDGSVFRAWNWKAFAILMGPLFYAGLIAYLRRFHPLATERSE